ncbi:MAG: branched-chain amino acid ABC transporter permease [Proteobacteria bacterium]|nr:branched-chain amino acid ABC transporter permease [Pseudomonadota bacterium]
MTDLLSGQLVIATLVLAAIYGLVGLGLNLIYGTMRLLNVAHGEILMLGGYLAYWSFTLTGIGPIYSMFVAMILAALLGAGVYRFIFRRVLQTSKLVAKIEANSLLVLFGVSIILQNVVALSFTATARAYPYLDQIIPLGTFQVTANRLVVLGIGLAVSVGFILFFRMSMVGLAIRALIQQPDAAALVGIDVDRTRMLSFALGFGMAGLSGSLISMLEPVTPFMGFSFTITAFVVIILGGLGNLFGGLAAALLLAVIEVYGVALTSTSIRSILIYGVFIAVLVWRPQGLFGAGRVAR